MDNKSKDLEEKIREVEKLNKLMVGRELKMIELKKEIARLKQTGVIEFTPDQGHGSDNSNNRFEDGIKLEEDVIQALENDYESMVMDSDLSEAQKSQIIEMLKILLSDSQKHEEALRGLS